MTEIEPAARRLFGEAEAHAWLAPCWRARARRAAALPFCADASDHHAVASWLRAGLDWTAARNAVEHIEAWRRLPAPEVSTGLTSWKRTTRSAGPSLNHGLNLTNTDTLLIETWHRVARIKLPTYAHAASHAIVETRLP